MKKITITGGIGLIGSHLVLRLLNMEAIERVAVFDNFSSGRGAYISDPESDPRFSIIEGNLKSIEAVKTAILGSDTRTSAQPVNDTMIARKQEISRT